MKDWDEDELLALWARYAQTQFGERCLRVGVVAVLTSGSPAPEQGESDDENGQGASCRRKKRAGKLELDVDESGWPELPEEDDERLKDLKGKRQVVSTFLRMHYGMSVSRNVFPVTY